MKMMLSIFGTVLLLASAVPSVLARTEATPPGKKTVTCPTLHGVVTVGSDYGGICGWGVRFDKYDGYEFDLNYGDKIVFDHVGNTSIFGGVCFYKFYDKKNYVGTGYLKSNCMFCTPIPGTNTLSCVDG